MVNTQQIGKCGVLLVQYKLLLHGIESSPLTTDYGIDLVAYTSIKNQAMTVQVKTCLEPKPAGGKGKLALDWWLADNSPAQLVALVDLSKERIWLFEIEEYRAMAQQYSNGRLHLYMYVDPSVEPRTNKAVHVADFDLYLLENRISFLFGNQD